MAHKNDYHIVKDQHHFVVEERLIKLNDIRLADFILVLAVIVDGLTLSAYPHVLVAVFRSCQFTHPVAESLVAEFVALACGCWNGGEDDVITKGLSYAKYANQLERLGACVIGGMFLARTHYKVR